MVGTNGSIFAIGDCTATSYAPTAQVASQEGAYLARVLQQIAKKDELQERLKELQVAPEAEVKEERAQIEKRLAKLEKIRPFKYSHQGSLAYIGSDRAIADLPFFNGNVSACFGGSGIGIDIILQLATGGVATFLFWRSAYLTTLFSIRNRTLVATDWIKVKLFGRYVSFHKFQ